MYKVKRFSIESRSFTRAEKQAFKELYKKTNGFRNLPTSSNPRDVFRFQKLTDDLIDLSQGKVKDLDRENAKTLLKNLGMDKSASQVDKVLDKYTNKRALARLGKKKVDIDGENIVADRSIDPSVLVKDKNSKVFDVFDLRNRAKIVKDTIDPEEAASKALESVGKPNKDFMSKMDDYASKLGVDVVRDTNEPGSFYFIKDSVMSSDGRRVKDLKGGVLLGKHSNEAVYGHELGHHRSSGKRLKSMDIDDIGYKVTRSIIKGPGIDFIDKGTGANIPYKKAIHASNYRLGELGRNLSTIAEENAASSYSLARLKKMGASKEELSRYKKETDSALGSYINLARINMKSGVSPNSYRIPSVPEKYLNYVNKK